MQLAGHACTRRGRVAPALLVLSVLCSPARGADPPAPLDEDRTLSPYFFVRDGGAGTGCMPLESTRVEVRIAGVIAEVQIEQVYRNDADQEIEAVYLFPLSTRAAVHAMRMTIGDRTIEAAIRSRKQAREAYRQARAEGRTASLLEQHRPNVFQMRVANILPGDEIRVKISYTELLVPRDGVYRFVYPAVVGPRYAGHRDAETWVDNPYLPEGEEGEATFGLRAELRSGLPVASLTSPSHRVQVHWLDDRSARLELEEDTSHANRDFVLRYRLAGDGIDQGLLLYPGGEESFFLLMMEPPVRIDPEDILPREYVFVLDVSGSMQGFPLDTAKELMRDLLQGLDERDFFNLLLFAGGNQVLSSHPLPATGDNIRRALELTDTQAGAGGTELLAALERALELPRPADTSRILVVISDGFVTVEARVFELIRERLADANLFTFGVGSSVNRHLIEGMARAGMGEPFVVSDQRRAPDAAARLRSYVAAPLLRDIRVRFEGIEAYDIEPPAVPDLFAERPIVVFGKYRAKNTRAPDGRVVIGGRAAGQELEGWVDLEDAVVSKDNAALRLLWARRRIQGLSDLDALSGDEDLGREITRLGLRYGLTTRHTSLVAIDTRVRADGKEIRTVRQPLPLPRGVGVGAVDGRRHGIRPRMGCVMGSLGRSSIQGVIRKNIHRVQACYERALRANPGIGGKVVVSFTIGPDGKVKDARVTHSTVADRAFQGKLLDLIRRWRFPRPAGGGSIKVSYPFIFRSVR